MSDAFSDNKGSALCVFSRLQSIQNLNDAFGFSDMYMLQSFWNDAGFILEISVKSNGRDKNASVIYSGTGPGQTSTQTAQVLSAWRSSSRMD